MRIGVVYIVDDDEAVRSSLAWLLENNGFIVSAHENGERFLKALQGADHSVPICILLDLNLPGLSGLEIQKKLAQKYRHIPVAFITGFGEIATVVKAFQQGAVDFIEKPFDEKVLCTSVHKMLLQAKSNAKEAHQLNDITERFKKLTAREKQVFNCIVDGLINREIAKFLGISIKTVEAHRASVMEKLKVTRPTGILHAAHLLKEAKKQRYLQST
jgi:FixJ family two-component response regulator